MALAHSELGQHPATACHVHLDVKRDPRMCQLTRDRSRFQEVERFTWMRSREPADWASTTGPAKERAARFQWQLSGNPHIVHNSMLRVMTYPPQPRYPHTLAL